MQDVAEIQGICSKKAYITMGREENTPKKKNQGNKTKVLPSLNFNDNYQVGPRISSRTNEVLEGPALWICNPGASLWQYM